MDDIAKQLGLTVAEVAAHTATALDSYLGDRASLFHAPAPTQPKKVRLSAVLPMLRDAAGRAITHRIFDQLPEARLRECSPPGTGLLLREVLDIEPEAVVKVKGAEWFIGTAADGAMCKLDAKVIPHVRQLASELTAERAAQAADLNEIVEAAEAAPRAYLAE